MYKAVIFDLDGTLTDTLDDLMHSVNHVLEKNHFPLRKKTEIRSFVGNGLRMLMSRSLPEGTSDQLIDRMTDELTMYYKDHSLVYTRPYEGICQLLAVLRDHGIHCAVATNKNEQAAKNICQLFFGDLIETVKGDNGKRPLKPSAECIDEIIALFAVEKSEILYVGDSEPDAYTAHNAGLDSVGVLWGFRDKTVLENAGMHLFAENCQQLKNIILNCG